MTDDETPPDFYDIQLSFLPDPAPDVAPEGTSFSVAHNRTRGFYVAYCTGMVFGQVLEEPAESAIAGESVIARQVTIIEIYLP